MNPPFLTLSPSKRYKRMKRLLHAFHDNALIVNAQFSIFVYGSASYGYNRYRHGNLDDIDLFLIVPRWVGVSIFLSQVQAVFLIRPEVKEAHLNAVFGGGNMGFVECIAKL